MFTGNGLPHTTHVHYTTLNLKCTVSLSIYIVDVYCAWMDILVCSLGGVTPMHTASRQ